MLILLQWAFKVTWYSNFVDGISRLLLLLSFFHSSHCIAVCCVVVSKKINEWATKLMLLMTAAGYAWKEKPHNMINRCKCFVIFDSAKCFLKKLQSNWMKMAMNCWLMDRKSFYWFYENSIKNSSFYEHVYACQWPNKTSKLSTDNKNADILTISNTCMHFVINFSHSNESE